MTLWVNRSVEIGTCDWAMYSGRLRSGTSPRIGRRQFYPPVAVAPHQWLMQERALKAKNLLQHSDRTLSGNFSAVRLRAIKSHFCRAFLADTLLRARRPQDGRHR